MKKIFLLAAIAATSFLQSVCAQDSATIRSVELLHTYYDIKNALVSGNAKAASLAAGNFMRLGDEKMNDVAHMALFEEAKQLSAGKDIGYLRDHFSSFSTNMYLLIKGKSAGALPVYYAYCPMKKAYWLSNEAAIKNPYFGNAMLTCGKVTDVIK